jgi:transcriptional regulator with XRE-family HTH domain
MDAEERLLLQIRENIIKFRHKKGLTQIELAARSGLEKSHIGKFETTNHNHTAATLLKLANALEIEPWQLLKGPKE